MRKKASISFTRDDLLYSNINSAAENSSVLYMIESSTSSIIKTGTTLNPANITFYSYKKVGDENYNAYTGWFKIQESTDGINWTDKYTSSSSGEISKTYVPTSSAKFIKCILYTNSGMTNQAAIISIGVLENGSSVTVSSTKYATNRDGNTQPPDSSFGTDIPVTSKGDWLWIKTTYSDGSVAISKSYIGTDGQDGKSIYVKSSTKVDGTTTIVFSDGTQDSTVTIVDGEDGEDGLPGQPGEDGTSSYIHIAWANSADGTQDFSTSVSTGKAYIGVYYDYTSADSTRPQDYNWSLIKGSDGGNTAVVYLYQRNSSTAVIDWTDLLTYDFANKSLVSVPDGWYKTVPSGTDPLYITSAIAYSKTDTDNIIYKDWSIPVILSENGEDGSPGSDGIDGKTSAIVYLYQRAASTPQVPSQNLTYTFSTGAVTGQGLGNWVQQVPSGTDPIYIISALAISNNLQYTIPGGTTPNGGWTTPRILAENGQDGKTPYIQNDFWYIDGTSTGIKALGEDGSSIVWKGESSSAPANPELNWCYRNTSDNKVYIYNGTNWVIMTQDGADGLDGYNQATLNIYRRTSSTLSSSDVPTSTTYNFSTKQIVGSLGSWTREIPEGTEQCWVSSSVAVSRTSTSDTLAWSEPVIFVKDGQDGNPGLNHATINLYKRIADGTSVTKPSTTSTYKFSDGTLSINGSVVTNVNGWSRDIPSTNSNSNPCYITTASVISSDDEVNITADNWPTPVKLVENGQSATQYYTHIRYSANSDGSNYDVSPSSSRPYIGVYNGKEQTAPPYGNAGWKWSRYLGTDGTSVTITSITYAVTTTEDQPSEFPATSAPTVPEGSWLWTKVLFSDNKTSITKTKSGVSGHDGLNQASITLYQRAASAPSLPSSDVTYRFEDGKFKVGSSTSYTDSVGNWVKVLPSINSSHPEYVGWAISASAISSEAEDTIASSEWTGPNKIIENGLNQAVVRVYKRSATTPTTSDKPTSTMTYTFSTGALSPDNSNGWTKEIPQADGNPCWVRSASVINTALTDTISTSDWGNAVKFVEDGKDGVSINNVVNSYLAINLSTGVDKTTPGWTPTIQQITKDKPYLWNYETVLDENDNEISSTDPIIIGHFGVDGIDGIDGVDGNSITSIDEFYKTTTTPSSPGSTGWQKNTLVVPDATNKYLWNYQVIHYSKTSDQGDYTKARIIGVYGDRGPQGYSPTIGNDGYWYINGSSTNVKAEGEDGKGIKSVTLLSTSGNDKTYRITFDDNTTTFDYTVTDGEDGKTLWGTSSTAYSTATKVVTCSEITSNSSLYEGLTIAIKFNTNSTTDTLKLQVGGSSAKDVYINNAIVSSTNKLVWTKTAIMTFMYDGTKWILMDQPVTYSADCSTSGTPGGKDVIINGCVIRKGTSILCKFTNKHASTTNTTLGIKSVSNDADISYYSIYSNGVQVNNANTWKDNQTVTLTFNGSYWQAGIYTDDSSLSSFIAGQYNTFVSNTNSSISTINTNISGLQDSKIETYYQTDNPKNDWSTDEYSNHEGDIWYDSTSGVQKYYRWNGSAWQEITATPPSAVMNTVNGKATIFTGAQTPSNARKGDLWFKSVNDPILTYVNGSWTQYNNYTNDSAFIAFRDGTYAQFVTSTNSTLGQKITTFYDSDIPTAIAKGDLWIDTTGNNNILKRWNGTSWEPVRDAGIQSALTAASNAQSIADKKIMTYVNTYNNRPTTDLDTGDLFIATDQNNEMYRWNGSSWISVADTSLDSWIISNYKVDKSNLQSQIDNKAETWYQSSAPSGTKYSIWNTDEKRKIHHGDLWYNTTDNTTWYFQYTNSSTYDWIQQNVPNAVFNKIDGKKDIYYTTGSTTPTPPYKEGDLWSNGVDIKICINTKSSGDYEATDWTLASNYIDLNKATNASQTVLNTWINGDFQDILDDIEDGIIDAKIETWYQSADPSSSWNTNEVKAQHVGDLWYYTGTTTANFKQNATYRWSKNYTWQQQNVPKEVFDEIDSKSDIYISQPSSYKAGDLWVNVTYPSTAPYTYQNDILRCTTTSDSFNINHWTLASKYTDDSVAETKNATFIRPSSTTWPTATKVGDLCIDTYNNNRLYRWNGSSWNEVSDKSETAKIRTKTKYALSSSNSTSNPPSDSSFNDTMPDVSSFISGTTNKYLWVGECISTNNGSSWSITNKYVAHTFNGLTLFANTVAGDSGLTTINGSKITTGRIQDSTGKNFIQIASAGTTTAGHLEFKDGNDWDHSSQGIQWNSSQGQLNIKGHITAKSLTIDGAGGSYNAYDAINISGYSIEITMNDEGSSNTNPANNVWLYPHLYHNGVEVFYVLTSDTNAHSGKTYYYYNSTTSSYVAYSTAPQNPKADRAYEYINYTKFHWYLNGSTSTYSIGDINHYGRLLVLFTDKIKVTYTFDDGASDGGMTAMEVTVDDSKYITRINTSSINIHPENTSGNSITLNSSGVNLASGKYLINGSDWAIALSDKYTRSSAGDLNWSSTTEGDAKVIAKSALAFWNGAYSGNSSNLSKCSTGNIIGSNGGTMTGQLKTSFKQSVAMGSYGSSQTTIEGLVGEVRYSSGCSGSASIGTAYTLGGVTIPTGWYNFSWMPHRSGGVNGAASGDNCNYGNLLLFGMNNTNGRFIIRVSSSEVQEVVRLVTTAEFTDYVTTQGSDTNGWRWRIWYSGRIEAWCTHTWTNIACTTQLNSTDKLGYRSEDVTLNLPSGLFSTVQSCNATMHGSGGSGYAMALRTISNNTTSISQMFWNSTSATKSTCTVDYYVTGI